MKSAIWFSLFILHLCLIVCRGLTATLFKISDRQYQRNFKSDFFIESKLFILWYCTGFTGVLKRFHLR